MENKNTKATQLESLLTLLEQSVSKDEFVAAFENVVTAVKRFESKTEQDITALIATVTRKVDAKLAWFETDSSNQLQKLTARVEALKPKDGKDGKDGAQGLKGDKGDSIKGDAGADGSPDMAEDIRNKLELLTGDERLKIDAIRDLPEELAALKKEVKRVANAPTGGGIVGRDIVRAYDLSASLDGTTTTFNLPAMWRIISVNLSSTPNVLRETTDYTWTPTSITFTSEINAATSLATGQTCIIIYITA